MKKRIIIKLLIFCTVVGIHGFSTLQAQGDEISTSTIIARVLDEAGQPVPDVFVASFVTNDKVLTDQDGNFTLKVSSVTADQVIIDQPGYEISITELLRGHLPGESITLKGLYTFEERKISLPYNTLINDRNVSAVNMVTGEELASYPSTSFLDALSGRLPGLVIYMVETSPGHERASATIRGEPATIYIDGIMRDPASLSVYEVESVEVIKDFSGRADLGISGVNPVIWITTRTGVQYNKQISVTAEYGMSSPTSLPKYLNSYQYSTLFNEALSNDGQSPLYSQSDLDAYRDGTNLLYFPNINYYGKYVKSSTPFRRANINFNGGDNNVNYFSMLDYVGSDGLETVGEQTKTNRFKLRGNVNIKLTDFIQMNINLSGTYGNSRYPNQGSGAGAFNMFDILSTYPANAHAMSYIDSLLLVTDNYGTNLDNELIYSGYAVASELNTLNTANLMIDLNSVVKGLTFTGSASFDIYSNITTNKGGTAALYRLLPDTAFQLVQEEVVEPDLFTGYDYFLRRTVWYLHFNYDRQFGKHGLNMTASYYQGLVEERNTAPNYQPGKMQDLAYRANYSYDKRYVLQFDLAYTGSMKLPVGKRFGVYPTVGAAWIVSNETFLNSSNFVDYLKLYTSMGVMGNDNFSLPGYNSYYLSTTLWQDVGDWQSGIQGNKGDVVNIYNIEQKGSLDYTLPKRNYFNLGVQTDLFNRALSFEVNYFYQKDYDQISQKSSYTPSLFGSGGFLPATNFGESNKWGIDGFINHTRSFGDFQYSVGLNILYQRGKFLIVDEPIALDEYRKLANKESDLIWMYEAEGLFQSDDDISGSGIPQSWGEVQPGDIKYLDFNEDGTIDEKDIHTTEAHYPRISYGINLSMKYKGIGLFVLGQGIANGETMLTNPRYFWINGTSQNYSELMQDRWPNSNDYPRLTTQSQNNYQGSSFCIANAAYLRLKNIELSYSLSKKAVQKISLTNFRIFVRGTNLLVLSDLKKYSVDPENINAGINKYPQYRTFTVGVSCVF